MRAHKFVTFNFGRKLIRFSCICLISILGWLGASLGKNLDRTNDIDEASDDLDLFAKFPNEAEYYRTSTDKDDYVAPKLPDENDIEYESPQPTISSLEILGVIEKISSDRKMKEKVNLASFLPTQHSAEQDEISVDDEDDATALTEMDDKTLGPLVNDEGTAMTDVTTTTSTEPYVKRTLKRPAEPRVTQSVLKAFRALHKWHFHESG